MLSRDYDLRISVDRVVYRLMKTMNLPKMSTSRPVFKRSKSQISLERPNHLKQTFNPPAPNQVWTSDFSYIPIGNKSFVYLCIILDLFSRKDIAWSVSHKINTLLAISTVEKAIQSRRPTTPDLYHTDQGSQYTFLEFKKYLENRSIVHSLSKPGYPLDNAVTEAFFQIYEKGGTEPLELFFASRSTSFLF